LSLLRLLEYDIHLSRLVGLEQLPKLVCIWGRDLVDLGQTVLAPVILLLGMGIGRLVNVEGGANVLQSA